MDMPGSWINDISGRFDAEYYYPEYLRFHQTIKRLPHKVFGSLIANRTRVLYRTTETFAPGLLERGTKFLSPSDVINGAIDWEQVPEVNNEMLILYPQGIGKPGDLLIEVKGDAKKAIVLDDRTPENALISGSFQKVWLKNQEDSNYILAVFLSKTWLSQRKRLRSNINIKFIDKNSLLSILIPWPNKPIRCAIGNEIHAAQRLRKVSSNLRDEINKKIGKMLPVFDLPKERMPLRPVSLHLENSERMDAWYYHEVFLSLDQQLRKMKNLEPLSNKAIAVFELWKNKRETIEYVEIGDLDINTGTVQGKIVEGREAPSRAKFLARDGDVAVSLVRPNRKNVGFIRSKSGHPIVVTSGCQVLRFDRPEAAALYTYILKSNPITYQLMRWNIGTSYPALEKLPLDKILVPEFSEQEFHRLKKIAIKAIHGPFRADGLQESAINDVEQLIDGTLDKDECLKQGRQLAEEFGLERP